MRTALAVDGGNSKTDAALVGEDGSLLGYLRGPQASPDHLGVEGSLDAVESLAGRLAGAPDLALLLLAGIDFPDEEERYLAAAERRGLAARTIVGNDTFAVLRAGSPSGVGIAVTCGAGINCVGVGHDGRHARFASLGSWSGDWGGGRDVGIAAIVAAARSADGRGPQTSLEHLVPAFFGLETPTELARALQAGTVPESRLPELAPRVLRESAGDAAAGEIDDRLADEVVTLAVAARARLGLSDDGGDVVLGGGILQAGNARLLGRIEQTLAERAPGATVVVTPSPPIVGSALLALDALGAEPEALELVQRELGAAVADS